MEIMEILSSRWLEVAVAVYLIGMMLYGHYRGFIKIAVSAMSLFHHAVCSACSDSTGGSLAGT